MKTDFHGILPAVVTPFNDDGAFCQGVFETLLDALYATGIHGLYVCGQTGEGLTQPVAQRKRVAETAVRCSPAGKQVIVHVGASSTAEAVELARHAARAGAHAISSLPPAGAYSFLEIRTYYEAVAAASDLPLFVYYFPDICPVVATMDQLQELLEIPHVAGLKFTDFNLYRLSLLRAGGAVVFNGRDEVLAAGMLMGANGGIGSFYNLVPELFLQVYDGARKGRWDEARAAQTRINELIEIALRFPGLSAVKKLLSWSGLECGPAILPRRALTPDEEDSLRAALLASSFAGAKFAGLRIS